MVLICLSFKCKLQYLRKDKKKNGTKRNGNDKNSEILLKNVDLCFFVLAGLNLIQSTSTD